MLTAIVDVDQSEVGGHRQPFFITEPNGDVIKFDTVKEIRDLARDHSLNVFQWWAFDLDTGESEDV